MRLALVVNPAAGARADARDLEARLRGAGAQVETFPPDRLEAAAACRPDRLVVAGGDGTLGPAAAAAAACGAALAVIPAGTANDFARGMGLPFDLEAACRLAATGTQLTSIELGRMDGRPFVNVASLGLAAVAAERARGPKRLIGSFAYAIAAVHAGLTAAPVRCRVAADGQDVFAGRAWQVIVASSGRFGGGASVDAADPTDGRLDVTVIPAGRRAGLVLYAYAMRLGRIASTGRVRHVRARTVSIEAPPAAAYNVDGEVVRHGSATFSAHAEKVEVVTG